jgi:hypothetical protein
MRFLIPAQTFAEHKHNKMPVFETLGLSAGSAMLIGGALGAAGGIGSALISKGSGGHVPTYNAKQSLQQQKEQFNQMSPEALQYGQSAYNQAASQGLGYAGQGTAANIFNQNLVTPGSQAQRQLAQNQINSYIQGQVPADVQQQINREVAQNLGGGFNMFSGGGQAPQNFARNLGQTSLGLSQYGLSAAPTWQQLANSMVVSPTVGLEAGLQSIGMGNQLAASAAGLGQQQAENQYQSQMNQYAAQQAQNQQMMNMGIQGASLGVNTASAINQANYLNSLSASSQIPASQYAGSMVPLSSAPEDVKQKYGWGSYANR